MFNVDTLSLLMDFRRFMLLLSRSEWSSKHWDKVMLRNEVKVTDEKIRLKLYRCTEPDKRGCYKGRFKDYNFFYNSKWNTLTIQITHSKVEKFTCNEIIDSFRETVIPYFNLTDKEMAKIKLSRIDIKNDYLCKNDEELMIIKYIISRTREKFRNYRRVYEKTQPGGYLVKYLSYQTNKQGKEYTNELQSFNAITTERNNSISKDNASTEGENDDETTSSYIEYTFYDKGEETKYRIEIGEADEEEFEKYKNIFRSEVKIKNGRLNSNYFENKEMKKELSTYYNAEMTDKLYHKYIKQIIRPQDFYRLDVAIDIISKSKYKADKKDKLIKLITAINEYGYTYAEEEFLANHSKTTLYSYIKSIEELDINIITFPTKIGEQVIIAKKIPNFTLFKNFMQEA